MGDITVNWVRPALYAKQAAFVDCPARYTVVDACTKAGKTVALIVWILEKAMSGKPGYNYWWLAPILKQAEIAFDRLSRWLTNSGLPKSCWTKNETDKTISFFGRIIAFKSGDKPDSIYGEDVYAAVVDEASRVKEAAWYALRSTLTATGGPVKIIGNVKGRKNWAYQLGQRARAGERNMAYFKLTAWDAVEGGVMPREEVEDAQRILPDAIFRELFLAEPSEDGSNPFGIAAIQKCIIPALSTDPPRAFGVDLAKSVDWTWVIGLDVQGHTCRSERWQSDWGQTERRIVSLVGGIHAFVDSTGVGDPIVEGLQRQLQRVEGYKFSSQSKQQLMEGLASAIQQQKVRFPAGILVDELESFEFEYTRSGVRYAAMEGLHDDGVCALALAYAKLCTPRFSEITSFGEVSSVPHAA